MTDLSKMTLEELYALADTDIRIKQRRGDPPLPNPIAGPETRKRVKDARAYLKEHNLLGQKVTQGSSSRYNVCAVDGTPIDDRVIDGQRNMPLPGDVDESDPYVHAVDLVFDLMNVDPTKQPESTLKEYVEWATEIANGMRMVNEREDALKAKVTQVVTRWDYADEDGDVHSPAWYIEAFMVANMEYMRLYQNMPRDDDPPGQTKEQYDVTMANHLAALDDALLEAEMYERYVNQLFGYTGE